MKYLSEILSSIDSPKHQDHVFMISGKEKYSYRQLLHQVKAVGKFSEVQQLKGKTILVSLKSDFELVCTLFGLLSVGVQVLLLDPKSKKRRLTNILSITDIDGWIVDESKAKEWELATKPVAIEIGPQKPVKKGVLGKMLKKRNDAPDRSFKGWTDPMERLETFPKIAPETIGLILFTSGTTSDPKGVPLSHGNVLAHMETLSRHYHLNETSVLLNVLPMYHADGLFQGPFLALYNRITVSRPLEFEIPKIEALLLSVYKHKVTHFITVSTMLKLIDEFGAGLEDSFNEPEFEFVISSASFLDRELWTRFMDRFKVQVINVYGLTETVTGGLFCGPDKDSFKVGTIGKPVDTEVRVIDDEGQELEPGQVGELVMKGAHVINSYLKPTGNPDAAGWFSTGDLGSMDSDGYYTIKGRKKEIIIRGGVNTYPEEIIEVLNQHSAIADAFVFGETDETWSEKIVAVVVKSDGSTLQTTDIIEYLSGQLEVAHMPDHIHFLDTLPRGLSGKISGPEVRELLKKKRESQSITANNENLKAILIQLAEESFNTSIKPGQYHSSSSSVEGWNSLAHLSFATSIEERFHIKLSTTDIMDMTSLSQTESIVRRKLNQS